MTSRSVRCLTALAAAAFVATPAVAQTTTVGDGTNPSDAQMCAGGPLTLVNRFTVTSTAAERLRGVRVQLYPATAFQLVETVQVRGGPGMAVLGTVAPTADLNVITIPTMDVPVGTTAQFEIWVKPRAESAMPPAQAGQDFAIQAVARSVVSYYSNETTDTSATLRIDNSPPAEVQWLSVTPGAGTIGITWKGGGADAAGFLALRRLAGPVTERLLDTGTYTLGGTVGTSTVVALGATPSLADSGLVVGRSYYYRVFSKDACGNWSNGTDFGPVVASAATTSPLEGDNRPGSLAPVVGILNPLPGTVSSPAGVGFKVQVRVVNPFGGAITNPRLEVDDGTTVTPYPLVLNANYGGDATNGGIFELQPLGTGLKLAAGRYTLRASASNGYGGGSTVYSARVGVVVTGGRGDGNLLVRDNSSQLCADCHGGIQGHSSDQTSSNYGSWYVGCRGCHAPHGSTNLGLVASQIQPPSVNQVLPPGKVQFSKRTGYFDGDATAVPTEASYANTLSVSDPTPRRTGPCQVCHTRTTHYRADGSDPVAHFTSNCGSCHSHAKGFKGTGCTGCHGTEGRTTFASHAPPKDTCGNTTATGGTGVNRVGAHEKHLASTLTTGVACTQCHVDPPVRADHGLASDICSPTARARLTWGPVATGSVDPWSPAVTPQYDTGTQTCSSVYCHGAFKSSGGTGSVTWGATLACDGCHGTPPTATHATTDTNCSDCHGLGYALPANGGITSPATTTHVNGKLEYNGTGCSGCHGSSSRTLAGGKPGLETTADHYQSAPPKSANVAGVPATQAHLTHVYTGSVAKAITCDTCHPVPATGDIGGGHRDGSITLTFNAAASAGGSGIVYGGPSGVTGTPAYGCSATYCHGDNFVDPNNAIKGTGTIPTWNAAAGTLNTCGSCHKQPPTDPVHTSINSRNQTQTTYCFNCHPNTVNAAGAIIVNGTAADTHVNGQYDVTATCTSCHGNPPVDAAGLANAANTNGFGKHAAHAVTTTLVAAPYACTECHPNDTQMNHANGAVDMAFKAVGGVATRWFDGTSSCGTSYCHGSTGTATAPLYKAGVATGGSSRAQSAWGGTTAATAPVWTDATGVFKSCSSCHAAPPTAASAGHPSNPKCDDCHPAGATPTTGTPTGITAASALLTNHVNGHVDVLRTGCTACHGDYGSDGVAAGDVRAAPGYGVTVGRDAAGLTSGGTKIGGHNAHLERTDLRNRTLRCDECHAVPTDTAHADGVAAVDMAAATSTTAKTGGLSPGYSAGTCSNVYCHGAGYAARPDYVGSVTTLGWTAGTAGRACGACHKVAPTTSVHADANNPAVAKNCGDCHGAAYNCTINSLATCTVDKVAHINGIGEAPTSCTACHAQPPATGSHVAHVNRATLRSTSLDCDACHGPKPADNTHVDGVKRIGWSTLATNSGTVTPTPANGGGFVTPVSCANYCHSPGPGTTYGGAARAPAWGGAAMACDSCHGAPPPLNATTHHPPNTTSACTSCHPAGYALTGLTAPALGTHIDGFVQADTGCTACHGSLDVQNATSTSLAAAPGYAAGSVDLSGQTSGARIGAHKAHLANTTLRGVAITCDQCHVVPLDKLHADGLNNSTGARAGVTFGTLADGTVAGGASTSPSFATGTCSNTYCHGGKWTGTGDKHAGSNMAPGWTQTAAQASACGTCHAVPPTSTGHTAYPDPAKNCGDCHPGYNYTTGGGGTLSPDSHINGKLDTNGNGCSMCHGAPPAITLHHPQNTTCTSCHGAGYTDPMVGNGPATHQNGSTVGGVDKPNNGCTACHGTLAGVTGAAVTAAGVTVAPGYNGVGVDSHGSSATTDRGVGAHDSHVSQTTFRAATLGCADCHEGKIPTTGDTLHADGTAATAIGPLGRTGGITTAAFDGTSCAATYCHGNFKNGAYQLASVAAPTAAPSITFSGVLANSLTVNWPDLAGASLFKIERAAASTGPWAQVATSYGNSYTDTYLTAGTTYWYRVRAWNSGGDGPYSTATSQATTAAGGTGAQRFDLASGTGSVGIEGTVNVGAQTTIPYSTMATTNRGLGAAGYTTSATVGEFRLAPSSMAASTVYEVVSLYTPPLSYANNQVAANVAANIDYRVRTAGGATAQVRAVLSEYSDATGDVGAAKGTYTSAAFSTTATGNRVSVTANLGNAAFTVTPGNRLKVSVQVLSSATAGGAVSILYGATQSTTAGVTYLTPTLSATAFTTPTAVPTGPTFTGAEPNGISLSWGAVTGAATYKVERAPSATGTFAVVGQVTGTSYTDAGLAPGTTYWYRVRASSPAGDATNATAAVSQATPAAPTGAPAWAGTYTRGATTLGCGSCHGNPPGGTHPGNPACSSCHAGYGDKGATQAAQKTIHIDGTVDVDCIGCHSTPQGSRREIVSEFAQAWSHKRSAGGAVTKWDCIVCHMEGDPSTGARTAVHGNGVINLRDPDSGANIKAVTFTGALGGTAAGSYSTPTGAADVTFTGFSRNLNVTLEADPNAATIEAIMVNQCLKCHDGDGAIAFNTNGVLAPMASQGGTRSAAIPFGTPISYASLEPSQGGTTTVPSGTTTAGSVSGGVINVASSFATTNSSYHPVAGRNNNTYVYGSRAATPWNATISGRTAANGATNNYGHLMSCWDCHAPEGTASTVTLTRTVTAHGGATTLRGRAVVSGTPSTTNAVTLCVLCHAGYNTAGTTTHGTGSALSSSTDGGMTPYLAYGCNKCHSSNYTVMVARPVRAADVHGVNDLPAVGTKTGRWSTNARPYAFIRNTTALSNHQPLNVGGTAYTPTCVHLADFPCSARTETYTVGGTY